MVTTTTSSGADGDSRSRSRSSGGVVGVWEGVAAEHSLPSDLARARPYHFASLRGRLASPWPSQSGYGAPSGAGTMSVMIRINVSTVSLVPVAGRYAVTNSHRGREVSITKAGRNAVTNNLSNVD